ncbi:SHOCT domain-containing protein [Streptomyces sp. NPDC006879]|uniref:SHOCT domain-containing protein n=1 Tax=Streptomyces sp. NPDC006879 TaxID=3364767 RepID=UPI0036BA860B
MPGLLRGVARTAVVAGTATAVSNRVSRRQAGRWAQQGQQEAPAPQYAAPPPPPPPPAPAGEDMNNKIEQLKQLGELKDQGILSEQEFEAQKRRILG